MQFTPDLLPADVTGVNVFDQASAAFRFRPGPVFANIVLVDEINRASPKTQSALLEAMQEAQVTVDGATHVLPRPFLVIATQNPVEYEGTYPLPEAQLDRFAVRMAIGYPPLQEEARMLTEQTTEPPLDHLTPVADESDVVAAIEAVRSIYVEESVNRYVVALLRHTRDDPRLALGASPRAGIALLRLAKARAVDRTTRLRRPRGRPRGGPCGAPAPPAPGAGGTLDGRERGRSRARRAGRDTRTGVSRSTAALTVGVAALLGSWLFGSLALAPVGIGLVVAALGARAWRRFAASRLLLERRLRATQLVEGDSLEIELSLTGRAFAWARAVATETVGTLGTVDVPLRHGRGVLTWPAVPRGRHVLGPAHVVLEDPLGLERAEATAPGSAAVLVRPRFVSLAALFTDQGREGFDGRRALPRRGVGVDLHGIRDYQQGEPLRLVHWPTTARRGVLSVLELQDAPRDETVVVLDCDPAGAVGPPGRSSFDDAARVTASLVRARAARGRPSRSSRAAAAAGCVRVNALDGSWEAALDRSLPRRRTARSLRASSRIRAWWHARTGADRGHVPARRDRRAALATRRAGGVVLVDAPTYAGASPSPPAGAAAARGRWHPGGGRALRRRPRNGARRRLGRCAQRVACSLPPAPRPRWR